MTLSRRDFLRRLGIGAAALAVAPATRLLGDPAKTPIVGFDPAAGPDRGFVWLCENKQLIAFSELQDPTSFKINPEWEKATHHVVFSGDYGLHQYRIYRAWRPVNHEVLPIIYRRCPSL